MRLLLSLMLVVAVAVAALLGVWVRRGGPPAGAAIADPAMPASGHNVQMPFAGTASCAGRACHGAMEPSPRADEPLFNEYTTWQTRDPHAGAYQALLTPRSQQIARQLAIGAAHEAPQCLACHTQPAASLKPEGPEAAAAIQAERHAGVGCEACHGNATRWLAAHTTKSWAASDAQRKGEHGMIAVSDPTALARQCVGCHVGAPGSGAALPRDVNHDFIAAGHPRLAFEFSSFLANLPAHWRPRQAAHAQRWAVGQAVAAEAALELLQQRAASQAPWPEFAEYDCFGCHHDVTDPSWRQQRAGGSRGDIAWGSWYFTLPRVLAAAPLPELAALTDLMQQRRPSRAAVAKAAGATASEMQTVAGQRAQPARALMDALLHDRRLMDASSWDAAEQTYLALWELNRSVKDTAYQKRLDALLEERAFRRGWDGPRTLPQLKGDFVPADFFAKLRTGY